MSAEWTATRRQLVLAGLASASGAVLASAPADAAAATSSAAADVVEGALTVEQLAVATYEHVLTSNLLGPAAAAVVRAQVGHEREHVAALTRALDRLGGTAPAPPSGLTATQKALSDEGVPGTLSTLHSEHDAVKLLVDLESVLEAAYFDAASKLSDPGLLRTCAEIMACEAQHWTALSQLQHHHEIYRTVPYPFVQGAK